jgi:pimeloyl-ACP methyl ester carboxylesterase
MAATALLLILLLPSGPARPTRVALTFKAPAPPARGGVVYVVDGVGGFNVFSTAVRWALPAAGVDCEVRGFAWSHGFGHLFKDLQDRRHLLLKAGELAAEIRRLKEAQPDRPVYVVAKSGGTGLVLAAAERLPPQTLERIVLLSAAVSPTYDLRPALRATRRHIVSFYSPYDQLILNWGTCQFGTADRVYGPSAGLRGFTVSPYLSAEDRALYDRLVQIRWHPTMLVQGNPGIHTGTSMPAFVAREVAPWLKP